MMDENEILKKELGKLGAIGGAASAGLLGAGAGMIGGKSGAQFAAERIGNDTEIIKTELPESPDLALQKIFDVLVAEGNIIAGEENGEDKPSLSAVVGSGFLNMNPAVVTVTLDAQTETGTIISVKGTAKEGLIKQHAGSKAAQRIIDSLNGISKK